MDERIRGRVWVFGDNVDTDQIIPAEYLVTGDPVELGSHAFEKVRPEFAEQVEEGDIILAADNFGCGSSREHAPRALLGCGVKCVIARSFARIFYRNSINIGLPLVECEVEAGEGDEVEVSFKTGKVRNLKTGKEYDFKALPEFLLSLIDSGGLVEYTREKLRK
ncbi:MAG: 3-isopropylmalate dehydratase [Candidatus Altiarchaeales archaeon]|nr:3-isopropylmalate dehydratase [Candidatus Altiarchaeales archaeon]MBD3415858.1 3-isopropylmalate dehydratase [Candidatus Altiarchaeales archaeon]